MRNAYFAVVAIALLLGTLGERVTRPTPSAATATARAPTTDPLLVAQLGSVRVELRLSA